MYIDSIDVPAYLANKTNININRELEACFTFSYFGVYFKVVWGEHVVHPAGETLLLLFDPPLVIEHVLCSKRHRVSRDG